MYWYPESITTAYFKFQLSELWNSLVSLLFNTVDILLKMLAIDIPLLMCEA